MNDKMLCIVVVILVILMLFCMLCVYECHINRNNIDDIVDGGGANGYIRGTKRTELYTIYMTQNNTLIVKNNKSSLYQNELYAFKVNGIWLFKYGVTGAETTNGDDCAEYKSHNLINKRNMLINAGITDLLFSSIHFTHIYKYGLHNQQYTGGEIGAWLHVMEMAGHRIIYYYLLQKHQNSNIVAISDDNFIDVNLQSNHNVLEFTKRGSETAEFFAPIATTNQSALYVKHDNYNDINTELHDINRNILLYQRWIVPVMLLKYECMNDGWSKLMKNINKNGITQRMKTNLENTTENNILINMNEYILITNVMNFNIAILNIINNPIICKTDNIDDNSGVIRQNTNRNVNIPNVNANLSINMPDVPITWYNIVKNSLIPRGYDGKNGAHDLISRQQINYPVRLT